MTLSKPTSPILTRASKAPIGARAAFDPRHRRLREPDRRRGLGSVGSLPLQNPSTGQTLTPASPGTLLAMLRVINGIVVTILTLFRTRRNLVLENLALRKQLAVLRRTAQPTRL